MKLSIVIVNYNVKYFLKQCLDSAVRAIENIDAEIFVVDNDSKDGSNEMIKKHFKDVILIENKKNVGFSKANNQAIRISKGEYVLLLNPDTIVAEDTFEKVITFMDKTPKAGGLGVRMIDGNGNFLPESKRGLPTPEVAFYKIFGFSTLFPKSERFGKYHLGNLPEFETNEIDILSGAFMFLRKETLDKVGLLDENFFMYGEDIDLSYRITLGGYKNYYYPDSTIVHYKGESTKKSSVNYVFIFYKAMAIFAEKYFGKSKAGLFNILIKLAIFFRAGLAIFNRLIEIIFLPLIDVSFIFFGLHFAKRLYQNEQAIFHDSPLMHITIGVLTLITITSLLLSGAYDKPVKPKSIIIGLFIALPISILTYLSFDDYFMFPTKVGVLAITIASVGTFASRLILHFLNIQKLRSSILSKDIVILGEDNDSEKTENLVNLTQSLAQINIIKTNGKTFKQNSVKDLLKDHNLSTPKEMIFCSKSLNYNRIIDFMSRNKKSTVEFKIAHPYNKFIIGSTNLNTSGELYTLKLKGISSKSNIRLKRILDTSISFVLLLFIPFYILFLKNKTSYIRNIWLILKGEQSFVGYNKNAEYESLPHIKDGVLNLLDGVSTELNPSNISKTKLNKIYAHDYSPFMDLKVLFRGFKKLTHKVL